MPAVRALRFVLTCVVAPSLAFAQSCPTPCDLAGGPVAPWSSSPGVPRPGPMRTEGFVRCGKFLFFVARFPGAGAELWRTDGTPAGTRMVRDLLPGPGDAEIGSMGCCAGKLFFSATNRHGSELWTSDGTAAGTRMVADIEPEPYRGSGPAHFACLGSKVLFAATRQREGRELWVSDGTRAGTRLVRDIVPGTRGSRPDLLVADGRGRFVAFRANGEIWRSDGTAAGTIRLWRGGGSMPQHLAPLGGKVLFATPSLWVTDGTPSGTQSLNASAHLGDGLLSRIGSTIYFSGLGRSSGWELWATDGTAAGTRLVADVVRGSRSSHPDQLTAVGSALFFSADDPTRGRELYVFASGRARLVKDLAPGAAGSTPRHIAPLDGSRALFAADDGTHGEEPWVSDGTPAGTFRLADLFTGSAGSRPRDWTVLPGGGALFAATSKTAGRELFRTDGTRAGTSLFADLFLGSGTPSSGVEPRMGFGDLVLMTADDGRSGDELWAHDVKTGSCRLVKDLSPGAPGSFAGEFVECWTGSRAVVFLAANHPRYGREPWITDGTTAGTVLLKDLVPGSGSSWPSDAENVGGRVLFSAWTPTTGRELWITDGTTAGTRLLKDVRPGVVGSEPEEITHDLGLAYFVADDGTHGREVWVTDGTSQGTRLLKDVRPGPLGADPFDLDDMLRVGRGGRLAVFTADDGTHGHELWLTDGTTTGTRMLKDVRPGAPSSNASSFVEFWYVDRGVFLADDGTSGREPWVTDLTAAGTRLLRDVRPGPAGSDAEGFEADLSGRRMIFWADDGRHGLEPWITDGTTAGTRMILDLRPGSLGSDPIDVVPAGVGWYFVANDGRTGRRLWFTDGSAAGTKPACPTGAGGAWTSPEDLAVWRHELLMTAFTSAAGRELHVLRNPGATLEWPGTLCPPSHAVLFASPPRLGTTMSFTSWRGPSGHFGFLILGLPARAPVRLPFSPCGSWMDLLGPLALLGQGPAPAFGARLSIPATPWFEGVTLAAQTLWAPTVGRYVIQASIPLELTLGR